MSLSKMEQNSTLQMTINQAWVTSALADSDVPKALTLCFSLKRTLTSRKVVVIVSQKLSPSMKEVLHLGFDQLFYLDEDWNTANLKCEEFVKVFTLTLKSFEKLVFLEPAMLVMKNSDEIFAEFGKDSTSDCELQPFLWVENGDNSVFGVRPCHPVFKTLMKGLMSKNGMIVEKYLRNWSKNQVEKCQFLDAKHNRLMSPQTGTLLGFENEVSIIKMASGCMKRKTGKFGILEQVG
ncbi:unnamed protein product [Orchesella dallaii]|uniref:Nucleotide-diphospho-sugar transferase domain-containing protein n=1 Tax=Orchesella dallaii TaxID=48710 RepID=A0ABP1Q2K5_9HEXA